MSRESHTDSAWRITGIVLPHPEEIFFHIKTSLSIMARKKRLSDKFIPISTWHKPCLKL